MSIRKHVTCYFTGTVAREGNYYVATCLGLPVVTQGKTDNEAMSNLLEAAQLFIESCIERGTLEKVLYKYHWKPTAKPPQELSRGQFALPLRVNPVVAKQALECQ